MCVILNPFQPSLQVSSNTFLTFRLDCIRSQSCYQLVHLYGPIHLKTFQCSSNPTSETSLNVDLIDYIVLISHIGCLQHHEPIPILYQS